MHVAQSPARANSTGNSTNVSQVVPSRVKLCQAARGLFSGASYSCLGPLTHVWGLFWALQPPLSHGRLDDVAMVRAPGMRDRPTRSANYLKSGGVAQTGTLCPPLNSPSPLLICPRDGCPLLIRSVLSLSSRSECARAKAPRGEGGGRERWGHPSPQFLAELLYCNTRILSAIRNT